jgi:hypothetical protein
VPPAINTTFPENLVFIAPLLMIMAIESVPGVRLK